MRKYAMAATLPQGFMWGGSLSSHQCEGAWQEGGKGLGIMDYVAVGTSSVARRITPRHNRRRHHLSFS